MPREIASCRRTRQLMANNVEFALDRGEVGAWLIDLTEGKRVFEIVGHARSLPAFG